MIASNVARAYLAPLVMVWSMAHAIPNHATGRDLARASFTTIAVPSALAAFVVTVLMWERSIRRHKPLLVGWRFGLIAAVVCGAVSLTVSALMVEMHAFGSRLYVDAVPSSVIGAATTVFEAAKAQRRRFAP
jgi:hypothetical protein